MIRQKTELERLRENLDSALIDLTMMNKWSGDPVIDRNIEHKKRYIAETEEKIRALEAEEAQRKRAWEQENGQQMTML